MEVSINSVGGIVENSQGRRTDSCSKRRMDSPRKRMKASGFMGASSSSACIDASLVSSRYSISHSYDAIAGLSERKKELVKSIGFEGLLYFPAIRQINRKFILWLMSKVDALAQVLVVSLSLRIPFDKEDVARVFGITCRGLSVADAGKPRNEVVTFVKRNFLGIDPKDNRSIKAAQEVVQRKHSDPLSAEEENAFKAAFVVFVMATLLSPGAKHDYALVEYWNAIVYPSKIQEYDWSSFALHKLLDGVAKVKADMMNKSKAPNITGCALFLQVLYLDSIDLGV